MNRENVQAIYPLLPNQEAFWLAHLHAKKDTGCLQGTYQLKGPLGPAVFQQALNVVVEQHAIMRATIQPRPDKSPLMVVWKEASPSLQFRDVSPLSHEAQQAKISAAKADELTAGIRPNEACPYRFQVFQTGAEQHELVWTFHHVFVDGWSSSVVIRDLLKQYDLIRQQQPPAPCLAKYEHFLGWRKTICTKTQSQFWRDQLEGYAGLPKRFGAGGVFGGSEQAPETIERKLGAQSTGALSQLAREHGLTAGSIAAGLWALTLSSFYQEDDVAFGATVSGRSIPIDHAQDMVGLFSNVVPMRQQITGSETMVSFLQSVRDNQFAIQSHEHAPLAEILSLRKLARDRSLFDTLLVVENYPSLNSDGELQLVDFDSGLSTSYPLTICILPTRDWSVQAIFDPNLLQKRTADSILAQFVKSVELLPRLIAATVADFQNALPTIEAPSNLPCALAAETSDDSEVPGSVGNPRNDTELKLTMIWEKTLGLAEVRYDDNFFEIGGRSLTATRVIAEINSKFGKRLSPSTLIEHPTVESLAKLIGSSEENETSPVLVRFNSVQVGNPLVCVNVGVEPAMFYRHLASYFSDRPVLGTQSRGLDRPDRLYESVPEAAADFILEIDKLLAANEVSPESSYDLVAYCAGSSVAFEMVGQLESAGRSVCSLTIVDSGLKYPRPVINIDFFRDRHSKFLQWFARYVKNRLHMAIRPLKKMTRHAVARFGPSADVRTKFRKTVIRDKTMKAYFDYEIGKVKTPMMLIRSSEYVANPSKDFHIDLRKYTSNKELCIEVIPTQHETILLEPAVSHVAQMIESFSMKAKANSRGTNAPITQSAETQAGNRKVAKGR